MLRIELYFQFQTRFLTTYCFSRVSRFERNRLISELCRRARASVYSTSRRVRGKTGDAVAADTFSTCALLTVGHKYDSPVLRKVFSSETNAADDNSERSAVAPAVD